VRFGTTVVVVETVYAGEVAFLVGLFGKTIT
jgi:hypothetical protein